jgi:DNA replication protein DnaC
MERRIRSARFPVTKSLDSFDFTVIPSLNKALVLELARCDYISRKENVLALGNSGTGKTHIALGLGLAACQKGYGVRFVTAASLVHELIEARDEKRLIRYQKQLTRYELLIVDELGFVPLSKSGAELLFEILSQRYERSATFITSNLPFNEWTEILGSERLTGALLDRLTHHVHILEMNGSSYRLHQSKRARKGATAPEATPEAAEA